ncbi:MAG: glycosyltransferase [Gemmatimonadota bacterium]
MSAQRPPRLLLGAAEVPTVGGLSTAAYDLFRHMLAEGQDAHYLTVIEPEDAPSVRAAFGEHPGNPDALPNTHLCWLRESPHVPQPELSTLMTTLNADVALGFGFRAARQLKRAAPERRTVFLTGNCSQAQEYVTTGRAADAVALGSMLANGTLAPRIIHRGEDDAVRACDLVVTHSAQTLEMITRFFPTALGRVYPNVISFAEWISAGAAVWHHLARPFGDRDIDVLFIASDWARAEKGYDLVKALVRILGDVRTHIVGRVPFTLPSVAHHGFLGDRRAMFELIGRARCVVCPSRIDAAPGILFEGAVMGSNVVASRNCGNWELCHSELLADPFNAETMAACILRGIAHKYDDNLAGALRNSSYDELMALVAAFTRPFVPEVVG